MDLLHELASEGEPAGTVVVAGEQTAGRGSRGRPWRSPPGGLWLSALYRPRTAAGVELVGLRVGLVLAETVEALDREVHVDVKWPNDLMLDDRKLGGILCEARWQGEALAWVVVGVGLNVSNPLPEELARSAIKLTDRIPGARVETLEPQVMARLRAFDPSASRLDPVELAALRGRDWLRGRGLRAPVTGIAEGIADDGALLVRPQAGGLVPVRAGTVELAEPSLRP
jgi:BirA family transcriptional regulator, biotin operon repressor / biotin---[acetyl-CoA-carboxylase] ligase